MRPHPRLLYGDSQTCPDLLYLTGVFIPDPFLWFDAGDGPTVIVSPLEYGRVVKEARRGTTVLSYEQAKRMFSLRKLNPESQIRGISRRHGIKRWSVPSYFPVGLVDRLRRDNVLFRAVKGPFIPAREIKTESEISQITDAIRMAESGLARALELLRAATVKAGRLYYDGSELTSERVQGAINATIAEHGGVAERTIVTGGPQGADPHQSGVGPLRAGQPIILDIFPRSTRTGYFGDLTRTVVKGTAPEMVRRAFAAVNKAVAAAKKTIRAGVAASTVHEAVHETLRRAGFETDMKAAQPYGFIHGTGHGLGLEIHEPPRLSRAPTTLQRGHVVTVEPGLYYPDWGGIRIEDVVVVEDKGCRTLTTVPVFLEL